MRLMLSSEARTHVGRRRNTEDSDFTSPRLAAVAVAEGGRDNVSAVVVDVVPKTDAARAWD